MANEEVPPHVVKFMEHLFESVRSFCNDWMDQADAQEIEAGAVLGLLAQMPVIACIKWMKRNNKIDEVCPEDAWELVQVFAKSLAINFGPKDLAEQMMRRHTIN